MNAIKRATAATKSAQSEALRKLGESCTCEVARLRRELRAQDAKIDGVRKDVNNLTKAQPSENNIADVQQ